MDIEQHRRSTLVSIAEPDIEHDSAKTFKRLVYKMSHETEEDEEEKNPTIIPKIVIFLNLCMSPLAGFCLAIRGMYDGRVSLLGISIKITYFLAFIVVISYDHRFDKVERWARLIPKIFGCLSLIVTLYGVLQVYDCDMQNINLNCI